MENQKIQQLIRLASIADNNGDYRIADKIFEKLAAAPPALKVPRMRVFEDFMKWVNKEAGSLEKLNTRIKDLKHLKSEIDKHPKAEQFKGELDLDGFYNSVKYAQKNLPEKKSKLELKQRELQSEENKISKDITKIRDLKDEIHNLEQNIKNMEYNLEGMGHIFEDMSAPPGLSYDQIDEELKKIEEKLTAVTPQITDLPKQDRVRLALETMMLQFQKRNDDALNRAIRTRAPIRQTVQVDSTKVKQPGKLLSPFTGTTETSRTQYTKDTINLLGVVKRVFTVADFNEAFKKFKRHSNLLEEASPATQGKKPPRNSFVVTGKNVGEVSIILRDNLKEMVQLYDFKFLNAYLEEVRILSLRRAEEMNANPRIGLKRFDPITNQEDFAEAANNALTKLQKDPSAQMIIGFFESIKTFIKREKEIAENSLIAKAASNDQTLTSKDIDPDTLVKEISYRNPNLLRDTGLSRENLKTIIEEGDNFSIEDFLDFAPGSVKKLDKPSAVLAKGLLTATLWKSPWIIGSMALVNTFAPNVLATVKNYIMAPFEKRKNDERAQQVDDRANRSRQRSGRNIP